MLFILWVILALISLPVAILALALYPIVWLISLPFRIVGIAVDSVFQTIHAILTLPARILRLGQDR